jgi:hypothetical protein
VQSLVSPLEVKVREPAACSSCKTHDCIRGNAHHRGCETDLFLPRKSGNLNCTFCLDCVRACPHDNIGLLAIAPGSDLIRDPVRSSLGRLSERLDVAALALVIVFAAFASAAAMTGPVNFWLERAATQMGFHSPLPAVTSFFPITLVALPVVALWLSTGAARMTSGVASATRELFCRYALALVPLGVTMWAAHFMFHFLVGYRAAWPLVQQTLVEWGMTFAGHPDWSNVAMPVGASSLLAVQILLLDAGLLLSLYVGWRIAREHARKLPSALKLLAPWVVVAIALYAIGVWIFLQPMQMRGLMAASM